MAIRIQSYSLAEVRKIRDIRRLPYYPGLERSGNYQRDRRGYGDPIGGVQHIAVAPEDRVGVDSSAEAVTAYGLNPSNNRASWNDCVDRDSYCPLLPPTVRPWQQGVTGMGVDMNCAGIGQEMGIYDTNWDAKPAWFVEAQLRMSAAVWAAWFTAYDWPVMVTLNRDRLFQLARRGESWGLTGHAVIDPSNRTDPGLHRGRDTFPWSRLLTLIKEEQSIRAGGGRPDGVYGEGDRGAGVKKLQAALIDLGYDLGPAGADGVWGEATTAAVSAHQRDDLGLTPGSWGPKTQSKHEEYIVTINEKLDALLARPSLDQRVEMQRGPGATRFKGWSALEMLGYAGDTWWPTRNLGRDLPVLRAAVERASGVDVDVKALAAELEKVLADDLAAIVQQVVSEKSGDDAEGIAREVVARMGGLLAADEQEG